jgi:hypothetical protein
MREDKMKQTKLPKRTLWYPGSTKPHRTGVYEKIAKNGHRCYQYWNGKWWGLYAPSPDEAYFYKKWDSKEQDLPWRGLEEKSE